MFDRTIRCGLIILAAGTAAAETPLMWGPDETDLLRVEAAEGMLELGRTLASGDLNGDGRDEVVARTAYRQLVIVEGSDAGRRVLVAEPDSTGVTVLSGAERDSFPQSDVADLDGDGLDDLVALHLARTHRPYFSELLVFFNRPSWPARLTRDDADVIVRSDTWLSQPHLGDLNGDGTADLFVLADRPDGRKGISVFLGGDGWPSSLRLEDADLVIVSPDDPGCLELVRTADVTGDGRADLIIGRLLRLDQVVVPGREDWPPFLDLAEEPHLVVSHRYAVEVLAADVTGDGIADLVYGSSGDRFTVFRGGESIADGPHAVVTVPGARQVRPQAARDLDGDGVNDFVLGWLGRGPRGRQPEGGSIACVQGPIPAGSLSLAELPVLWRAEGHRPTDGMSRALLLDINGDGDPDLATSAPGVDLEATEGTSSKSRPGEIKVWSLIDVMVPAPARPLHVDLDRGSDTEDGLSWSTARRTLESALTTLDGRSGPAHVSISQGVVTGPILVGRGTTLEGGHEPATGARRLAPSGTVVQAGPHAGLRGGTMVTVRAGEGDEKVRLEGLEIRDARQPGVSPGLVQASGELELSHVVFSGLRLYSTGATCEWMPTDCRRTGPLAGGVAASFEGSSALLDNVLILDSEFAPPDCYCEGVRWDPPLLFSAEGNLTVRHVTAFGSRPSLVARGPASLQDSIVDGVVEEGDGAVTLVNVLDGYTFRTPEGDSIVGRPIVAGLGRLGTEETGQGADSPGIDLGSLTAEEDCHASPCMAGMTTRLDGMSDEGTADLGFHWDAIPNGPPSFGGVTAVESRTDCALRVTWDAAIDPDGDAVRYAIYRAETPGAQDFDSPPAGVVWSPETSWEEEVPYGIERHYVVRASDPSGWSESNLLERSGVADDFTAPAVSLNATPRDGCEVRIYPNPTQTWCSGRGPYELHRSATPGFSPSPETLISTSVGFGRDMVPSNGLWYYRRIVEDEAGNVGMSDQAVVRVDSCAGPAPAPLPPMLQAVRFEGGRLIIPFDDPDGGGQVRLHRGSLASLRAGRPDHAVGPGSDGVFGTDDDVGACHVDSSPAVDAGAALAGSSYWVASSSNDAGQGPLGYDSHGALRDPGVQDCD